MQRGHDWNKMCDFFANKKENFLRQHFLAQKIKDGRAQITVFSAQKKHQRCLDEPFACLLPVKDDIYALQLDSSSTQVEVFVFLFCR